MTTAVETKVCTRCNTAKAADEFARNQRRDDGLSVWCRPCHSDNSRTYRQNTRLCLQCGKRMGVHAFPANPGRDDGLGTWCTPCHTREARRTRNAIALKRQRQAEEATAARAKQPETLHTSWRNKAGCRGKDTTLWFPIGNTGPALLQIHQAKQVCQRQCPVMEACLQYALTSGQEHGVFGGMSEDERKALKRKAARNRSKASA